jgi:hypothetical protein
LHISDGPVGVYKRRAGKTTGRCLLAVQGENAVKVPCLGDDNGVASDTADFNRIVKGVDAGETIGVVDE